MKSVIYVKYGELTLKGKNKIDFINCLFDNVKKMLKTFTNVHIEKLFDALIIKPKTKTNQQQIIKLLLRVPGINLIIPAYETSNKFTMLAKNISEVLTKMAMKKTTFKVITKRADKSYFMNSMEVSCKLGELILKKFKNWKVDVHTPKLPIYVEIKKDSAFFYFEKIKGTGGFPLGINGKVLLMISGGIDSPIAANLLIKKGLNVDFLTFISPPHTDDKALNKVRKLKEIVTLNNTLYKSKLYIVNFTSLQHEIAHISDYSYQITIMRRYFFRIAKHLAIANNYQAIATGESLGQVASQTIQSMQTIQDAADDFLVLRPLLTMDKSEIIEMAQKIGTYDISILPYDDACSLFVPANPVTKPTIHKAKKLEEELTLMETLLQSTLLKHIIVE
ncbi:MAG: tRNA 4-thiouridine(8) synthase ThiI [Mycoplasmataceae bacterium]|nr:tRNA 4-thiouridine(8) synthase ThiI [Mycoplasmataceae bacterium]